MRTFAIAGVLLISVLMAHQLPASKPQPNRAPTIGQTDSQTAPALAQKLDPTFEEGRRRAFERSEEIRQRVAAEPELRRIEAQAIDDRKAAAQRVSYQSLARTPNNFV